MFADTSAIVAMLLEEDGAGSLSTDIERSERRFTSPVVRLETCMVISTRRDVSPDLAQYYFDALAARLLLTEVPIDERVGRLAVDCFRRYGKGRHAAQLNFGDCLSYACAKAHRARLLYKGDDFAQTDVNDE